MFNLKNLFDFDLKTLLQRNSGASASKDIAKNRLQMVLVQDRSGLTSQNMEDFKKDIIEVISRYFTLEQKDINIEWQREDSCTALIINTPIIGKHDEEELVAAG